MVEAFSVVTNKIDSKRENATVFFKNIEKCNTLFFITKEELDS